MVRPMFIAHSDLRNIITDDPDETGKIRITNFSADKIRPSSYDFRVGKQYICDKSCRIVSFDQDRSLTIFPGQKCTVKTLEEVYMPRSRNISGIVTSSARLSLEGLSSVSTLIDPNWEGGSLFITVTNNGPYPIKIRNGTTICRAVFFEHAGEKITPLTAELMNTCIDNLTKNYKWQKRKRLYLWGAYAVVSSIIAGISYMFGNTNLATIVAGFLFFIGNRVLDNIERFTLLSP